MSQNKVPIELKIQAGGNAIEVVRRLNQSFGKTIGATKRLSNELRGTSRDFRQISGDFSNTASRINRKVDSVTRTFKQSSVEIRRSWGETLKSFSYRAAVPSAAVGLFGGMTVRSFGDFELELNKVRALTKATGDQFAGLSGLAKELGSSTQFSASEAAQGMGYLAMAGFKTNQIMQAMPATLDLATAAQIDLGTAADLASNIMSGFKIEAAQLGWAGDVLSNTFTNSNTTLVELAESFKAAGPLAKTLGMTFEETNAILGVLASNGYKGERAGTALAGGLARLIKPVKGVKDAFKDLKISESEFVKDGKLPSFVKVLDTLQRKGATTAQFMQIFGQDAGKALVSLKDGGAASIRQLIATLERSEGATARLADSYKKGVNGAIKSFKSALEAVQIAIGESGLGSVFTKVTNRLADFLRTLAKTNPTVVATATVVGGLVAVAAPVAFILGQLIISTKAIGAAMAAAAAPAGIFSASMLPIVGVVTAVGYAGWFLYRNWEQITVRLSRLWTEIVDDASGLTSGLTDLWEFLTERLALFAQVGSGFAQVFRSIWAAMPGWVHAAADAVASAINRVIGYIAKAIGWVRRQFGGVLDWFSSRFQEEEQEPMFDSWTTRARLAAEDADSFKFLPDSVSSLFGLSSVPKQFAMTKIPDSPTVKTSPRNALEKLGITPLGGERSENSSSVAAPSGLKIQVDFNNTPRSTSIAADSSGDIDLDINVGYQGGAY